MILAEQKAAARSFALKWQGKGYEKGESQKFWLDLLCNVFGVKNFSEFIEFEDQVKLDHTSFIDGYIPQTKVLIEQKSVDKNLRSPIRQSDGTSLTPFEQAKRYITELPLSKHPRYVVTCNFKSFLVYDMENPGGEPSEILLENLEREFYRLQFLTDSETAHLQKELEVSKKAGEIIGEIYDAILSQYKDAEKPGAATLKSLNMLCVRIVFCLYAEDAGIFGHKSIFGDYLAAFEAKDLRRALLDLFRVLDLKESERDEYLEESLAAFPYVNGGLFSEEDRGIPQFTEEIQDLLVRHASGEFDWSEISPTIFGAIFESTLNPETRRKGGMHYTSIENIHKVIDPLFMDALKEEFQAIKNSREGRRRDLDLVAFQKKLGNLRFLDPACGSGNFLTETYLSLRRLENECLKLRFRGQAVLDVYDDTIFVKIHQLYGIELNDFAAVVAKTALWIAESQMMRDTAEILQKNLDFLPLKSYANIVEGNALRMDWATLKPLDSSSARHDAVNGHSETIAEESLCGKEMFRFAQHDGSSTRHDTAKGHSEAIAEESRCSNSRRSQQEGNRYDYIMGNPPFVGFTYMSEEQKKEMDRIFPKVKNLDYVCAWYKKASDLIQGTNTRCAFVSTNSITQGETVGRFLPFLRVKFDFAYRTFRWDSESTEKAHVHCVIIGFSCKNKEECHTDSISLTRNQEKADLKSANGKSLDFPNPCDNKFIIDEKGEKHFAKNINGYLLDALDVVVESRAKSLCHVPQMIYGNKPADGGFLILTKAEKDELLKKEPKAKKWIYTLMGGDELLNNRPNKDDKIRFCLWLEGITPAMLKDMPLVLKRVSACREKRLASPAAGIRKFAETPHLFAQRTQPEIPKRDDDGNLIWENGVETYNLLVPRVSSEKRKYIPIGYISKSVVTNDQVQIIPNATLFHFGVLTSSVHMAWMRAVCGRLKSDYRYSKDIVYNNFPFIVPKKESHADSELLRNSNANERNDNKTETSLDVSNPRDNSLLCSAAQAKKIEQTAQAILDARSKYPDSSLADLYDETLMPADLRKAHEANDRAVMQAYGFDAKMTEAEIVAELFNMYGTLALGH